MCKPDSLRTDMTERLYYTDSRLLEFEARIVESRREGDRYVTVLDRSAFYPTSGGQSHDTGKLDEVAVLDVTAEDHGEVRHLTGEEVGPVGAKVIGRIDKERRRRNSQNHTAQHLLSAAFDKLFGLRTVSVHLGDEYGAVELAVPEIEEGKLEEAERRANEIIGDNLPVEIMFVEDGEIEKLPLRKPPAKTGRLRIIKIDGYECSACGGTHCATTGGVGLIKITGTERLRGNTLVKFLSGQLAFEDYESRFSVTDALSRQLTCHPSDLVEIVGRLSEGNKELRRQLTEARKELLPVMAEKLAVGAEDTVPGRFVFEAAAEDDKSLVEKLAAATADRIEGLAALMSNGRIVLAASEGSSFKAGALARQLAAAAGLKGGGNDRIAQLGGADAAQLDHYRESLRKLLNG